MAAIDNTPDRLQAYRAKRAASRTPEPFGTGSVSTGRVFVVQEHFATRLHFDFRLEFGGVLKSWAVPRGPSSNPEDKRLAVHTEDHPLEYADFEGIIPEGNYGAGAVIVWDQGTWTPREDFEEGYAKGKLLFQLHGYKLHGVWTLVKIKKSENEWLLIKERDGWATGPDDPPPPETSVFSGLTVEELRSAHKPGEALATVLDEAGAPPATVNSRDIELMHAQSREVAFSDPDWLFELKYDGYRILASRDDDGPLLLSRHGHDLTATFPEVAKSVAKLPYEGFVLDGEVVVHDENGLPSFQRLQKRGRLTRRIEIARAAVEFPAVYYAFDLLALGGHDLRSLPLIRRKEFLHDVLPEAGPLRYSDHVVGQGEAFFEQVRQMHLEGIMAKRADAPYRAGRSPDWIKIRLDRSEDFVVVGFSEPKGTRSGIGSLHLASFVGEELVYAGRVGTGFNAKQLDETRERLEPAIRGDAPCSGVQGLVGDRHHWVEPDLVCEVRYKEWPEGALLRHPVFVRFRDDMPIEDCVKGGETPAYLLASPAEDDSGRAQVPFTNLDKVFWPVEGYTKGDLIDYYRAVSPWLLPYLKDRPLVLTRFPDGIDGKSFFQKDSPEWTPEWVRREAIWSEDSGKETHFFVAGDVDSLSYIINLGAIPLHIWSSRIGSLERPDWSILDLDPKEAPFTAVIDVALAIKRLCDRIDLPCFVKTSGSSGMHVLVPLGRQVTYHQSKLLAELLARVTASDMPDIATTARALSQRKGRVYIDFVQNGHGKLLVSPLCVRPLPAAPVSMPLDWPDVRHGLQLEDFTIRTAPAVLEARQTDPMHRVLTAAPDLATALDRLGRLFAEQGAGGEVS